MSYIYFFMKSKFYFLPVAVFFISISAVFAQSGPGKFGRVEANELTMRVYDKDTSAAAVILSDVGYSYFTYNKGFKIIFERHTRIKILKKSGYDAANIVIPYYQQGNTKEQVSNIKGYTYNLEGSRVSKDKLDGTVVFDEKLNENWFNKKIAMPNVKEGSVIEYSYTITSDFLYNLRSWEFQTTIPVVFSEYKVRIPEYFVYKQEQQGYLNFDVYKKESGIDNFMVTFNELRHVSKPAAEAVKASGIIHHWVIKNAPALRQETYITTLRDYQSKIDFELQSVKYPNQSPQIMTGDWEKVTREMLESEYFGSQLNQNGFFKNEVAAITAKHPKPEQQMAAVHDFVKTTVKWNGMFSYAPSGPIRKAFENKKGNAADINLLLIAMLRNTGLDAAPVLLSTRENGRVPESPMLSKFNYVVAHVVIGDKEYLLDATDPLLPAGMLPVHCLNGQGRLIKKVDQRWVALVPTFMDTKFFSGELTINSNGALAGKATESSNGYNALRLRKEIKDEGEAKYAEKISKEIGTYKIEKPTFSNVTDLGKPLNIDYQLTSSGSDQHADVIYLNPMMGQGEKENPFKLENRLYPVDLAVPIDHTYMCRFAVPEGYEVEEAPKNAVVTLPENGGKFMYMIEKQGNSVQITSKISVLRPVYYAPDYPYLKEFYNLIVAKHAEQIVLKKVASN